MRLWPPLLLPAALTPELAPPMQPAAPVIKAPPVPSSVPVQPITLSPPLALQLQRPLPNFAPIPVAAPNPALPLLRQSHQSPGHPRPSSSSRRRRSSPCSRRLTARTSSASCARTCRPLNADTGGCWGKGRRVCVWPCACRGRCRWGRGRRDREPLVSRTTHSCISFHQCPESHLSCIGCTKAYGSTKFASSSASLLCMHSLGTRDLVIARRGTSCRTHSPREDLPRRLRCMRRSVGSCARRSFNVLQPLQASSFFAVRQSHVCVLLLIILGSWDDFNMVRNGSNILTTLRKEPIRFDTIVVAVPRVAW
ncbi:hypothetical protein BJ912DRAFT_110463 [Pholiota molesta]|nr:hypothetical protein BJ912DRAFT_110463 [Pholiota molesta]